MQITLLIKCHTPGYLNIVAYSLFLLDFDDVVEERSVDRERRWKQEKEEEKNKEEEEEEEEEKAREKRAGSELPVIAM